MKRTALCLAVGLSLAATGSVGARQAPERRTTAPPASAPSVAAGINRFSIDLYKALAPRGGNLFVSPASVSIAVGLAYRGAEGSTADELARVLHYAAPPKSYLPANAALSKAFAVTGEGGDLRLANALWLQHGMPLRPDFEADMVRYAKAGLNRVDYRGDREAARSAINAWAEATTAGKIRQLLRANDISEATRATLVNTIYWKGRWASMFAPNATTIEPFTGIDGQVTPTPLMHQQAAFKTAYRDGVRAIELPYAGGKVSMLLLMPDSPRGLRRFEQGLTDARLTRWLAMLDDAAPRDTILSLPKLRLEWRDDLVPTLEALGAKTAFTDDANFSGMAIIPYPGEVRNAVGLKIKKVIHQTFIDIDETGSEAAAATAVVMDVIVTGMRRRAPPPFVFRADKPFLFLLRHQETGVIFFMGRYVTPA